MIDIKALEKKPVDSSPSFFNEYQESLKARNFDLSVLDQVLELNKTRKDFISQVEAIKSQQNKLNSEVFKLKKQGLDAADLIAQASRLADQAKDLESKSSVADEKVREFLLSLPNKIHSSVPHGTSADENIEIKKVGQTPNFSFVPKEHFELAEALDIIDFARATKVTGARFSFLKKAGALLERALMQLMLNTHSQKHGYTEILPPFIVNSESLVGTGQFPKFKEDVFHLSGTDYYLIPTAEVPITNFYAQEILTEDQLPQKFVAYSPCFRSEAGSYGRDTKGLIRQHQFDKVELMVFAHPEYSYQLHEELTAHAEQILIDLELPFRRVLLCSGDMGFASAKTYDLEVWLPGQKSYREISSCTNFEDFQARRANIRYKNKTTNKLNFVHTINGSGLAIGRTVVAILENYQDQNGQIHIPKVLQSYMGGLEVIK